MRLAMAQEKPQGGPERPPPGIGLKWGGQELNLTRGH